MRRSIWTRLIAVILIVSMLAVPVSAAGVDARNVVSGWFNWSGFNWGSFLEGLFGGSKEEEETQPVAPDAVETEPVETEPVLSDDQLILVEGEETVQNSQNLRATTYALNATANDGIATVADEAVVYYPVTIYNYNASVINAATHMAEINAGGELNAWNGVYFNGGNPETGSYTYTTSAGAHTDLTWAQVQSGTYYSEEDCTTKVAVTAITEAGTDLNYSATTVSYNSNSNYTTYENTQYYYKNGSNYEKITDIACTRSGYIFYTYKWTIKTEEYSTGYNSSDSTITIYEGTAATTIVGYTLTAGGQTLATLNSTDTSAKVGVTLYTAGGTETTDTIPYAPHNVWTNKIFDAGSSTDYDFGELGIRTTNYNNQVGSGSSSRAGYIYNGLVANRLDANKDIVFNVPEGGIFNDDTSVKDIYTNVGLPFQKDGTTYTFNAAVQSAKFNGTPTSNTDLVESADGQFWPFGSSDQWHFGMNATIPFTMTLDGKLTDADGNVEDIVFNFAGDDDVWVFIDGILVLDIGGIHNSASGSINFATNETSVFSTATDIPSGYINTTDGAVEGIITGHLFDGYDADGNKIDGVLGQTIETFAATDYHELTVFYLERGQGVSNCMIEFNLPIKDTLSVKKLVEKAVDIDTTGKKVEYDLTEAQKAVIDNMDFGFTLYDGSNNPVANKTYILLNANGQVIATPSTDSTGHFTLKNGQTAKFVGEFSTTGESYYVVEDIKNGFIYTDFTATGTCANGWSGADVSHNYSTKTTSTDGSEHYYVTNDKYTSTVNGKTYTGLASSLYTVKGGMEAEDNLAIVAENYLNWTLPTPTALPNDDKIVIDYGLPVVVDLFKNDYVLGNSWEITFDDYVGEFGTFTYADGKITYTLNKQLNDVEVIEYTLTATAIGSDGASYTHTGTANLYIIPATSMYYEENFTGLVTFKGSGWKGQVTTSGTSANQEPGVVGTVGDSTYGSDVAYMSDSQDSNGTSYHGDTTNGAIQFSYTFTGTGTSFFARTSANTGYLQVKITNADGSSYGLYYRDTYWEDTNESNLDGDTLYNIPVFTEQDMPYGTYTVTVTVAKAGTPAAGGDGAGNEFYLDGIRVMQPMDMDSANASVATAAYAADGEANMEVITLRNKLITDSEDNWNFVVFTDTNGEIKTAANYISFGPKEEVYLMPGQSITFTMKLWNPNELFLYLGMKAPFGSAKVQIGNFTVNLANAADCYYNIGDFATLSDAQTSDGKTYYLATFTITATDGIVALTNIKVTGTYQFVLVPETDENYDGSEGEGIDGEGDGTDETIDGSNMIGGSDIEIGDNVGSDTEGDIIA